MPWSCTRFLGLGLACSLLAVPVCVDGQVRVDPPERVSWPLIDFLVLGDSIHGVQVLASPNLSSAQGHDQNQAVTIALQPVSTRLWAAGIAALVESIAKLPHPDRTPFVSLALTGNLGRTWLRISLGPEATPTAPFDFEILDSSGVSHAADPVAWSVPASAPDILVLLTALDAVAERSVFDSAAVSVDVTRSYLAEQLDRAPETIGDPDLSYPTAALAQRREGRVWVEFVIDTAGAVQTETARVLMSDGEDFSQAVLAGLARVRFTPGVRRGSPVKTLVWAPVFFGMAQDSANRIRLPFAHALVTRHREEARREVPRHCRPAAWPKQLPALDALVDSARVLTSLQQFTDRDTSVVVLSLLYQGSDTPSVRLVDPAEPTSSFRTSVEELVRRAVRAFTKRPPIGAVRVRLRNSFPFTATVERSIYCPAEPLPEDAVEVRTARAEIMPGDRVPMPGDRIRVVAKSTIDENGQVAEVDILVTSGVREIDETLATGLKRSRYQPATLDGIAVPSWVRSDGSRQQL